VRSQNCEKRLLALWCLPACLPANLFVRIHGTTRTGFQEIWYFIFENLPRKFKFHKNLTKITGYFTRSPMYSYDNTSLNSLRMRSVSEKSWVADPDKYLIFNNFFPRKSCRLWDDVEKYDRAVQATDGNIIRRIRFACWITKAAETHS
jgi:hypothetical protein